MPRRSTDELLSDMRKAAERAEDAVTDAERESWTADAGHAAVALDRALLAGRPLPAAWRPDVARSLDVLRAAGWDVRDEDGGWGDVSAGILTPRYRMSPDEPEPTHYHRTVVQQPWQEVPL